jgi:hypothetical protein
MVSLRIILEMDLFALWKIITNKLQLGIYVLGRQVTISLHSNSIINNTALSGGGMMITGLKIKLTLPCIQSRKANSIYS